VACQGAILPVESPQILDFLKNRQDFAVFAASHLLAAADMILQLTEVHEIS